MRKDVLVRYITLKEIIENIYKTQGLGMPDNIYEAVDNILHKPNEESRRGVLYPVKDDELSVGEYSSIRNAGAADSHSHFPRKLFKEVIKNISNSGNAWIKEYVKYLETQIDYPIIRMNEPLQKYIDEVIKKLEAGETLSQKTIIMDEKGFDASTITQEDVDNYGI